MRKPRWTASVTDGPSKSLFRTMCTLHVRLYTYIDAVILCQRVDRSYTQPSALYKERERERVYASKVVCINRICNHIMALCEPERALSLMLPGSDTFVKQFIQKRITPGAPASSELNPINRQCLPASLNNAYNSGYTRKNKVSPNIFNITMIRNKNRCFLI